MPIPTYTPGYPPDGSSLGQTKSTVRNNLDGTFQTLGIDHINNNGQPGSKPAGYHNVIHVVPQAGNPGAVTGYGQLFSKTVNSYTTDQALFWETGAGLIQQLTVNLTPSAATNGYTFIPGGIILQWGFIPNPARTATQNFNITFPNACFNVQLTTRTDEGGIQGFWIDDDVSNPINATRFAYTGSSPSLQGLYWFAIGR